MAAVCGYMGRTDKSPGPPWALGAARGRRRAADAVKQRARPGGPKRRLPSCEALGVRGSPCGRAPGSALSRAPAAQAGRGWPSSPAGCARGRQGPRWLFSVPCRLPALGCAPEDSPPWDTDPTKLPGRCY